VRESLALEPAKRLDALGRQVIPFGHRPKECVQVSGLLNAFAEVGYVLGLAVLIPLSAARTDSVAHGVAHTPDAALVQGFRWAFYAGAALAVLGALIALILIRAKGNCESRAPDKSNRY
jgi:hypothetical protein